MATLDNGRDRRVVQGEEAMTTHFEKYTARRQEATRLAAKYSDLAELVVTATGLRKPPLEMEVIHEFFRKDCRQSFYDSTAAFRPLAEMTFQHGGSNAEFVVTAHVMWALNNFLDAGRQAYQVSPGLSQRLLLTELRGLRCGDLRLPYRAVYVEIDPALGFVVPNNATGDHPLCGAYIVQDGTSWLVVLCGDVNGNSAHEYDDAILFFWLRLDDENRLVTDALRATFSNESESGMEHASTFAAVEPPFRWVLNLLFYITRPGYDDLEHLELNDEAKALWRRMQNLPAGKKRDGLRDRWRAAPKRPRIYVGRSVPVVEDMPRRAGASLPVNVKTLVAGHFMRYHVGPGGAETVWKFREPFWRGGEPDGDEKPHYVR